MIIAPIGPSTDNLFTANKSEINVTIQLIWKQALEMSFLNWMDSYKSIISIRSQCLNKLFPDWIKFCLTTGEYEGKTIIFYPGKLIHEWTSNENDEITVICSQDTAKALGRRLYIIPEKNLISTIFLHSLTIDLPQINSLFK